MSRKRQGKAGTCQASKPTVPIQTAHEQPCRQHHQESETRLAQQRQESDIARRVQAEKKGRQQAGLGMSNVECRMSNMGSAKSEVRSPNVRTSYFVVRSSELRTSF